MFDSLTEKPSIHYINEKPNKSNNKPTIIVTEDSIKATKEKIQTREELLKKYKDESTNTIFGGNNAEFKNKAENKFISKDKIPSYIAESKYIFREALKDKLVMTKLSDIIIESMPIDEDIKNVPDIKQYIFQVALEMYQDIKKYKKLTSENISIHGNSYISEIFELAEEITAYEAEERFHINKIIDKCGYDSEKIDNYIQKECDNLFIVSENYYKYYNTKIETLTLESEEVINAIKDKVVKEINNYKDKQEDLENLKNTIKDEIKPDEPADTSSTGDTNATTEPSTTDTSGDANSSDNSSSDNTSSTDNNVDTGTKTEEPPAQDDKTEEDEEYDEKKLDQTNMLAKVNYFDLVKESSAAGNSHLMANIPGPDFNKTSTESAIVNNFSNNTVIPADQFNEMYKDDMITKLNTIENTIDTFLKVKKCRNKVVTLKDSMSKLGSKSLEDIIDISLSKFRKPSSLSFLVLEINTSSFAIFYPDHYKDNENPLSMKVLKDIGLPLFNELTEVLNFKIGYRWYASISIDKKYKLYLHTVFDRIKIYFTLDRKIDNSITRESLEMEEINNAAKVADMSNLTYGTGSEDFEGLYKKYSIQFNEALRTNDIKGMDRVRQRVIVILSRLNPLNEAHNNKYKDIAGKFENLKSSVAAELAKTVNKKISMVQENMSVLEHMLVGLSKKYIKKHNITTENTHMLPTKKIMTEALIYYTILESFSTFKLLDFNNKEEKKYLDNLIEDIKK